MSDQTRSYVMDTEIPKSYTNNLYEFLYRKFLLPQRQRFADISKTTDPTESALTYTVLDSAGNRRLRVESMGNKPINLSITPLAETVSEDEISKSKEDIDIAVDFFEQQVRNNTLFFAWREGESIVPETISMKQNRSLRRVFLETQVFLMVIFMAVGLVLFSIIGPFVAPVLLALLFISVFYSNRIIARLGNWRITESNPIIHLLEYPLPLGEEHAIEKISKENLVQLKKEIYEETISAKGELDCQTAHKIFAKYGIECKPENLTTRKVNVYELIKKIADKFGFPMPEIVVTNTLVPNAAASGPSPSRGVVLITTGLFVQLKDSEILSVLGHEFGHLKGRDPLWLYGISAVQYLLWFYVIFGTFIGTSFFLLFIYFWALAIITYFIAKFFEARADLTSAIVMGQPNVLADALEKIGFQRLLYERMPSFRIQEWLSMDPHPPIYFRIYRLRKLGRITDIKHPLIQSARDVTRGFLQSF